MSPLFELQAIHSLREKSPCDFSEELTQPNQQAFQKVMNVTLVEHACELFFTSLIQRIYLDACRFDMFDSGRRELKVGAMDLAEKLGKPSLQGSRARP